MSVFVACVTGNFHLRAHICIHIRDSYLYTFCQNKGHKY